MSLLCYTVDTDPVPGIDVGKYESILTDDPGTAQIQRASLMMYPLFDSPDKFGKLTQQSLTFVKESDSDASSRDGVLLSVNSAHWRLMDTQGASLVDPGGKDGFILIHALPGNVVLQSRSVVAQAIRINNEGIPEVCVVNRANAMFDAIKLSAPAPKVPSFSKPGKDGKGRRVSTRPGILPLPQ